MISTLIMYSLWCLFRIGKVHKCWQKTAFRYPTTKTNLPRKTTTRKNLCSIFSTTICSSNSKLKERQSNATTIQKWRFFPSLWIKRTKKIFLSSKKKTKVKRTLHHSAMKIQKIVKLFLISSIKKYDFQVKLTRLKQ